MNSGEYSDILKESLSENKRDILESMLKDTLWNASVWSEISMRTENMWNIPSIQQIPPQQEAVQESFITHNENSLSQKGEECEDCEHLKSYMTHLQQRLKALEQEIWDNEKATKESYELN